MQSSPVRNKAELQALALGETQVPCSSLKGERGTTVAYLGPLMSQEAGGCFPESPEITQQGWAREAPRAWASESQRLLRKVRCLCGKAGAAERRQEHQGAYVVAPTLKICVGCSCWVVSASSPPKSFWSRSLFLDAPPLEGPMRAKPVVMSKTLVRSGPRGCPEYLSPNAVSSLVITSGSRFAFAR